MNLFSFYNLTEEKSRFTVLPAVALLNYTTVQYMRSDTLSRIFSPNLIFTGFSLYFINFAGSYDGCMGRGARNAPFCVFQSLTKTSARTRGQNTLKANNYVKNLLRLS